MERFAASSDLWPDIKVKGADGLERTFSIGLEVTYDFDPTARRMAIAIRGLGHGVNEKDGTDGWVGVYHQTSDPRIVGGYVAFIGTARQLACEMGLPDAASFAVSFHLERMADRLSPFVEDCFLGRTLEPEVPLPTTAAQTAPPTPKVPNTVPPHDNVLVVIDRDISGLFGENPGTCMLEYNLFSEPSAFRAVIAAHYGKRVKKIEFLRKEVNSIIRDLNGDSAAFEIASFYGNTDSHVVHLVSAVLKLGFAMNTGLAQRAAGSPPVFAPEPPPVSAPGDGDTQPMETVKLSRDKFTVYNGGYFDVEVPTS